MKIVEASSSRAAAGVGDQEAGSTVDVYFNGGALSLLPGALGTGDTLLEGAGIKGVLTASLPQASWGWLGHRTKSSGITKL